MCAAIRAGAVVARYRSDTMARWPGTARRSAGSVSSAATRWVASSRRQLLGERNALGHVPVSLALADIVQEHAQHQEVRALDLVEHLRDALGLGGGARGQRLEALDGDEGVLVGRELVVHVVLHEA